MVSRCHRDGHGASRGGRPRASVYRALRSLRLYEPIESKLEGTCGFAQKRAFVPIRSPQQVTCPATARWVRATVARRWVPSGPQNLPRSPAKKAAPRWKMVHAPRRESSAQALPLAGRSLRAPPSVVPESSVGSPFLTGHGGGPGFGAIWILARSQQGLRIATRISAGFRGSSFLIHAAGWQHASTRPGPPNQVLPAEISESGASV